MANRFVENERERERLIEFIADHEMPFTCSITKGHKRSLQQNRLQRLWIKEICAHNDGTTEEEIRGFCKLMFAVPILRAENEAFREKYDQHVKPLQYEQKIALMMEPLDMPVTRLMTTKQKTAYLEAIKAHFPDIPLTNPDDLGRGYG